MQKLKESKANDFPALLVEVMDAAKQFHILHLRVTGTGSYAAHKALNDLYDALPGHADDLAEGYQGAAGELINYPDAEAPRMETVKEAISYIEKLTEKVTRIQDKMPYSEIVNDMDNLKSTLNSAKYKLKFLS